MASLAERKGDLEGVLGFETEALALRNTLGDLDERGVCHSNLANTLNRLGQVEASRRHRLASLVYGLLSHDPHIIATRIRNLSIDYRMAREAKLGFSMPGITKILEDGDFSALKTVLDLSGAPIDKLQARVDAMVTQVRAWSRVRPMF
jgi:hypothetical protein